jgi:hypothetical protein
MVNVIRIMRVVNIETKYDREGNPLLVEHPTIQRTGDDPIENFEITYDAEENRRLVSKC